MERLNETAQDWVPHVRRLRPDMAWEDVLRIINGPLPPDRHWTQSRLLRAVKAYVRDGFPCPMKCLAAPDAAKPTTACLPSSPPSKARTQTSLFRQSATGLESMRERTPRGRTSWQPSSVRMLLERAERLGLLVS